MKFIRYRKGNTEYRGVLDGETIKRVNGSIFHEYSLTGEQEKLSDVTLLAPILPSKIIGLRLNSTPGQRPEVLRIFMKPASAVIGTGEDIVYPNCVEKLLVENELAIVIGKRCRDIEAKHAAHYILGVTVANDVTGASPAFSESFTSGKYFDTFAPIGPVIDTACVFDDLHLTTRINGELVQESNTSEIGYSIGYIVSYLSGMMSLLPGDVIMTGALQPAFPVNRGDTLEMEIEKIGTLRNRII